MSAISELIRSEADGTISFGDYTLDAKAKLDNFGHQGDLYKVKTYKDITKLERNGMFVYESVPGTAAYHLNATDTGISFDTDVEAVRSFDELLDNPAFFGFENDRFVNTGEGFGAEPHNPAVRQMLAEYDPLLDGQHGTIGCPRLNTDALLKLGLELNGEKQKLSGAVVFPEDFFNPRSSVTGELRKTENTHSIHWYSASWMPWHKRLRSAISKPVHFILGRAKGRGR